MTQWKVKHTESADTSLHCFSSVFGFLVMATSRQWCLGSLPRMFFRRFVLLLLKFNRIP